MIFKAKINASISRPVTVDDICPNCKKPTNPDLVNSSYFSLEEDKTSLVLTFRCLGCSISGQRSLQQQDISALTTPMNTESSISK